MKRIAIVAIACALSGAASAQNLYDGLYEAFPDKELSDRFTPRAHQCTAHCGRRTVQETRVHCTQSERPAHIGGQGPSWEIHEETWLVEEHITVDTMCKESIVKRTETRLASPQYWPEDDIWNPVPYEESGLTRFNCADLSYDRETNRTEAFVYRIVVGYGFGCLVKDK